MGVHCTRLVHATPGAIVVASNGKSRCNALRLIDALHCTDSHWHHSVMQVVALSCKPTNTQPTPQTGSSYAHAS